MSADVDTLVKFEIISPGGPYLAHHVGCTIGDCFYVHGGINRPRSKVPLNGLHEYSFSSRIWSNLTSPESPSLSHHAGLSISNRYFLLIGGWNGRSRISDVYAFDTSTKKWLECHTSDFPTGSGLSSHTANLMANGDVLVIGREGFLRTQRRYASMFLLSCKLSQLQFKYRQLETTVLSRSGHTCDTIGANLFLIGGRNDHVLETHPFHVAGLYKPSNSTFGGLETDREHANNKADKVITRKYHATALCNSGSAIFLHGGWALDGRHKDAMSDCFLLTYKPTGVKWVSLGESSIHLSGHVMCASDDRLIVHGGENQAVRCTLYEILPQ